MRLLAGSGTPLGEAAAESALRPGAQGLRKLKQRSVRNKNRFPTQPGGRPGHLLNPARGGVQTGRVGGTS